MPTTPDVYKRVNPTGEQLITMDQFRTMVEAVDKAIREKCPPGRNQAMALTALEEVQYRFNKGVTHDSTNPNWVPTDLNQAS